MKVEPKCLANESEWRSEVLALTKTKYLVRLREWCQLHDLQRSKWIDLYADIIFLLNGGNPQYLERETSCCVQQEMGRIESEAKSICKSLDWIIIRSQHIGSHEVFDGNILVGNIFYYGFGFSVHHTFKSLHGDIYSAALELLPPDTLDNKINVNNLEAAFLLS